MTTSLNKLSHTAESAFYSTLNIAHPSRQNRTIYTDTRNLQDWRGIFKTQPILQLLRPDFYLIFRYNPFRIIYQENIRLDLGANEVTYNLISRYSKAEDFEHIQRIDSVIEQLVRECRIQPFDFVCKILCNIEIPNEPAKRFMRTTFVGRCDQRGNPDYGVICFHDFTMMTGSIKPYNFDITFAPDKVELCHEAYRRIRKIIPKAQNITLREREIITCLDRGMSSKETGDFLFISKATVDTHRQNMLRKYSLSNTSALLRMSKEQGWI